MSRLALVAAAALLLCLCAQSVAAEARPPADLNALLEPLCAASGVPALAGAILRGQALIGLGAVGLRRNGGEETVTAGDRWHLGSCTKAMTSTLLGVLVERGKMQWDTTVGEVFGELVPNMDEGWRDVRIEQLLDNHGGAPGDVPAKLWSELWASDAKPRAQRLQLARGILSAPPAAPAGAKFIYSNAGFAIAGAMAEQVTDTPWEELMQREIFKPLGMESAGFGAPGAAGKVTEPRGHRRGTEGYEPVEPGPGADNPFAIGPAGIVHASLADWAKFIAVHLAGARKEEGTLVGLKTLQALQTPQDGATYAGGWGLTKRPWADGGVLTHSGSNTMWYCVVWIAPAENLAVLVATNQAGDDASSVCDKAAWALIQRALKE